MYVKYAKKNLKAVFFPNKNLFFEKTKVCKSQNTWGTEKFSTEIKTGADSERKSPVWRTGFLLVEGRWWWAARAISHWESWRKLETIFTQLKCIYCNAEAFKACRRWGTRLMQGRFPGNCSDLEGKGEQKYQSLALITTSMCSKYPSLHPLGLVLWCLINLAVRKPFQASKLGFFLNWSSSWHLNIRHASLLYPI